MFTSDTVEYWSERERERAAIVYIKKCFGHATNESLGRKPCFLPTALSSTLLLLPLLISCQDHEEDGCYNDGQKRGMSECISVWLLSSYM